MNELEVTNSGTSVYSPEIKEAHKQGVICLKAGDYQEAEKVFTALIHSNPNLSEAHLNLGNAFFKQNRIDDAINCWRKALSLDSTQVNCYINLGNAFYAKQDYNEAINHWIIAVTMAPNHAAIIMNLGAAYEKLNDHSTAYKYYEEFLELKDSSMPNDFKRVYAKLANLKKVALHNLKMGVKYQKKGHLRNAVLAYKESIKSYPNFSKAHLNLGSICYMTEKFELAIHYWFNSIKLDPKYAKTYCNIAVAYEKNKQYSYAYCYYKRYLQLEKVKSKEVEDVSKRTDAIFEIISKKSKYREMHLEKAKEYYKNRSFKDALIEYENYSMVYPNGEVEVKSRIDELNDNLNPKLKAAYTAYEVGKTCYAQQKFDKAIEAFKRYLHFDPNGKYANDARQKTLECGKLMGRALKAFVAGNQ